MDKVYEMMVKAGYKEGDYKKLTSMNFYKYHGKKSHMINQCKGFHNKVMQMMIQGILWNEKWMNKEVSMVDESNKNKKSVPNVIYYRRVAQIGLVQTYSGT